MRALAVALSLLAACTPPLGRGERAVINGVFDPAHPEVGLLSTEGDASCTATLIGSRTVLTAAHCLSDDEKPPYTLLDPISLELGGKSHAVGSASIHSTYSGWSLSGDIAVARLAEPVVGIAPALAATAPPSIGEAIVVVGYGCTTTGPGYSKTFGTKRKGENTIAVVSTTELSYPLGLSQASLCEGDSGGPSFAIRGGVEILIGVHSYELGEQSFDQRVDAYHAWIAQEAQGDLYQGPPAIDAGPQDATPRDSGPTLADREASAVQDAAPPAPDGAEPRREEGGCGLAPPVHPDLPLAWILVALGLVWRRVLPL